MPYSQPVNQENQSRSSYGWNNFSGFAKVATVFVTAVGGYVLARASGVFSGWGSKADAPAEALTLKTETNALSARQSFVPATDGTLSPFNGESDELLQSELTAFHEVKLAEKSSEAVDKTVDANLLRPSTLQSHHWGKRVTSPLGNEFLVNTYTTSEQTSPALILLANGNVMVVWESEGQDGSSYGIYGQVLTATGDKVGTEFPVNTYTLDYQTSPALTLLADGNVMVTWVSYRQNENVASIYGQVLMATGDKVGTEFPVNTYTLNPQSSPALTLLANGNVMVTWVSLGQDGSDYGIYGQVLTATGGKAGTEFRVNTYTISDQTSPALILLANDNVMVTWTSEGQDGSGNGIYGQVLTATGGKAGTEFRVNTYTLGSQASPALALLANGNVMVTWESNGESYYGIYGQVLTATGDKVGNEFRVNTYTLGSQASSALALLANGNVMVTWESNGGSYYGIYGQVLTTTGAKVGTEFPVNTYKLGSQAYPVLALLANGNVMVTWVSFEQDGSGYGIYGSVLPDVPLLQTNTLSIYQDQSVLLNAANLKAVQLSIDSGGLLFQASSIQQGYFHWSANPSVLITQFYQQNISDNLVVFRHDASASAPAYDVSVSNGNMATTPEPASVQFIAVTPSGNEFPVNTYTTYSQASPALALLANGNIMVTWASFGQDGSGNGIYGQVLTAMGAKVGIEFPVNTYTTSEQASPALILLTNGNVMVTWQSSEQDGSLYGIYGQVLTATGAKVGTEFPVNTYTTYSQASPALALLANGNIMVTWASFGQDGSGNGIYGQVLTATGAKVGAEFLVNTYTTSEQASPALTLLTNGNVMVIWASFEQDGSSYGIYGQVLTATGARVGAEFPVNTYTLNNQYLPALALLVNGNVMVVWASDGQDESGYGIYGQILTATGAKVGAEFLVNTYTLDYQISPALILLSNSNVMVTWVSGEGQDGSSYGIYGQVLTAMGAKVGGEFPVNVYTLSGQHSPTLTQLSTGNVMVVWESESQDGSSYGIYGRMISTTPCLPNNRLILSEGQTVILNTAYLNTVDINDSPANLQFTVRSVQGGTFARINAPAQGIEQFTQQDINSGLVQFAHNGTEFAPSYEIAVTDGVTPLIWHVANISFTPINDVPILMVNGMTLQEGQRLTLTELNLQATDEETAAGDLRFIISNFQHGIFSWLNSTIPLDQFYQQNITDRQVQFTHDGTELAPSYEISVSDGQQATAVVNATINFAKVNDAPILLANQLTIKEGRAVVLSENELNATDEESPDFDFVFKAEQVRFGEFQRAGFQDNVPVTQFSRRQIADGFIQFVHDGSDNPPSYQISVSDGADFSVPESANIRFNAVYDSVLPYIIAGAAGGVLLFSIVLGMLAKRYRDQRARGKQNELEMGELQQNMRVYGALMGKNLLAARGQLRLDKLDEKEGRSVIDGKWALINEIKKEEAATLEKQTGYHIDFPDNQEKVKVDIGRGSFGRVRLALCLSDGRAENEKNKETQGEKTLLGRYVGVKKIKGEDKIEQSLREAQLQGELAQAVVHIMPLYDNKEIYGEEHHDLVLAALPPEKRLSEAKKELKALSKQNDKRHPVLIRQDSRYYVYGYAYDKWELTELEPDQEKLFSELDFVQYPNIKLLENSKLSPELREVIQQGHTQPHTLYQFMLFAGFGNGVKLKYALAKLSDSTMRERIVLSVAHQLLKGFAGMHAHGIYHLDFKPDNLVLNHKGDVYIIDFGCALKLGVGKRRVTEYADDKGDFNYYSPERWAFYRQSKSGAKVDKVGYDAAAYDSWTLGLTLYELASGEHLLKDVDLVSGHLKLSFSFGKENPLWRLIEQLLDPESSRLTPQQALKKFFGDKKQLPFENREAYQQAFTEQVRALEKEEMIIAEPASLTLGAQKAQKEFPKKFDEYYKKDGSQLKTSRGGSARQLIEEEEEDKHARIETKSNKKKEKGGYNEEGAKSKQKAPNRKLSFWDGEKSPSPEEIELEEKNQHSRTPKRGGESTE